VSVGISLNYDAWNEFELSPIWLTPQNNGIETQTSIYQDVAIAAGIELCSNENRPLLPLPVTPNLEFDEIVDRCAARVAQVVERLRKHDSAERG